MSTATLPLAASPLNGFGRNVRIFANEARYELIRALRTKAFSLATIGFPIMFYCLFGLLMNRGESLDGVNLAKYLLGSYAVFGALGAAIFGIGVGVATDLGNGWLELKRASPMPPIAYLLSKCVTAAVFGMIIATILTILGISFGNVHLTVLEYIRMMSLTAAGAIPFSCLGLAVALTVPPASAGGVANLIYLPMSFCSGLWWPLQFLPHFLQVAAPALPTYNLASLMRHTLGAQTSGTALGHWSGLVGFTCIMLGIAWIAFRRREQTT
jgi:ABC-2 type transport system permease protein